MGENSNKVVFILLVVMLVVLLALGSVLILRERTSFFGKASQTAIEYSLENSYVFASPLSAQAGGGQKIKVTIFLLDGEGKGVADKSVSVVTNPTMNVDSVQPTTDEKGQAVFEVSADTAGKYTVTAETDSKPLQPLTLTFN